MTVKKQQDQWSQEIKDFAYEVWAFKTGRNPAKTAEIIAEELGVDVPYRTVKYWADSPAWHQRAEEDANSIAPAMRRQAFAELIFAAVPAARYLRAVVEGTEQPEKYRVQVALGALDRVGFSPIGSRDPSVNLDPGIAARQLPNMTGLTISELMRLESEYRDKRQVLPRDRHAATR